MHYLPFEKPIYLLEEKLQELVSLSQESSLHLEKEIQALKKKIHHLTQQIYHTLSPWQRVQIARHPKRPYTLDYIQALFPSFHEIYGDRLYAQDPSIIAGFAQCDWMHPPLRLAILGHQKGRSSKEKLKRHFGMPKPEGYRKAIRLMQLAQQFQIPLLTFLDTPGAYPGVDAEARGQSLAIAQSLEQMAALTIPTISIIIGEGGSGGALALGLTNQTLMQTYSIYSVISPESCATILWGHTKNVEIASQSLKLTSEDLKRFEIIDEIIPEPLGGAHRNWEQTFFSTKKVLKKHLKTLLKNRFKRNYQKERFETFQKFGKNFIRSISTPKAHKKQSISPTLTSLP